MKNRNECKNLKTVDLFLFMGQSNMAGRGLVCEKWPQPAPCLIEGAGYEYRAVSAPDRLYPLAEPFGRLENTEDGINDEDMKTGSLVTAFVNACYRKTGVPIVGISASKGGSSILEWQPGTPYLSDTLQRLAKARNFLGKEGYFIRHTFILWCQGETDGDHQMTAEDYQSNFMHMWKCMKKEGLERCFLIQIGKYNGAEKITYEDIRQAQEALAEKVPRVVMAVRKFEEMKARGLMKDDFHYYQQAYNEVGMLAGENAGEYIRAEVMNALLTEYDEEKVMKSLSREFYEDGYEAGKKAGREAGREAGLAEGIRAFVIYNLGKGIGSEQIISDMGKIFSLTKKQADEYFSRFNEDSAENVSSSEN